GRTARPVRAGAADSGPQSSNAAADTHPAILRTALGIDAGEGGMGPVRRYRHTSSATLSISERAVNILDRCGSPVGFAKTWTTHHREEISMKTYTAGAVLAVLLGFSSLAQAGQLLSPPLPTRTRETNVTTRGTCRIFNTGTKALSVKVAVISNND